MAVEQVMEIRVEIERVMDERGDSSEELLQSLTALENVDVDLEILEATMIGKVVNALRKSNEERISKAAKNLLKRWKALVKSPTGSASEMKTVYSESSSVSKRKASDNREESFNHSKKAKESESDENLSSCSALRAPLTFTASMNTHLFLCFDHDLSLFL